jgi:hypothetical protein
MEDHPGQTGESHTDSRPESQAEFQEVIDQSLKGGHKYSSC